MVSNTTNQTINLKIKAMISSRVHSIIDYLVVIFLFVSPTLFNFGGPIATTIYIMATAGLLLTVATNFEYGIVRMIPFRVHRIIELLFVVIFVLLGFTLSNDPRDRSALFFFAVAAAILMVSLLTDWRSATQHVRQQQAHQHQAGI